MSQILEQMGMIGIILLICSILLLSLIIERFFFFIYYYIFQTKKEDIYLENKLLELKNTDREVQNEYVSYYLKEQSDYLHSHIKSVQLISHISPMLGLIGTVFGIIETFRNISEHTGNVTPNIIASGLWLAMYTTAFGLLIALPAIVFAYLFKQVAQKRLSYLYNKASQICLAFNLKK